MTHEDECFCTEEHRQRWKWHQDGCPKSYPKEQQIGITEHGDKVYGVPTWPQPLRQKIYVYLADLANTEGRRVAASLLEEIDAVELPGGDSNG